MSLTRRTFLERGAAALATAAAVGGRPINLWGNPLGKSIGIQLYTVKDDLKKDLAGTLRQIGSIGYKEVEMAGFFGKTPKEFKTALDDAGLHCGSSHLSFEDGEAKSMDYAAAIGAKYVVSSVTLPRAKAMKFDPKAFLKMLDSMTYDDYKGVAEECTRLAEEAGKKGLQFAYHNHNFEFKPYKQGLGYDLLLKSTDPKLVKFELDCGWMSAAGQSPAAYISRYPDRYRMLHIKDFKPTAKPSVSLDEDKQPAPTELGRGHVDYPSIFKAAKNSAVEWYYVEQEPPFVDMPAIAAAKVDFEYLHSMS